MVPMPARIIHLCLDPDADRRPISRAVLANPYFQRTYAGPDHTRRTRANFIRENMGVGPAEEVDGVWMSRDEGGLHENVGRETAMVAGPIVKVLLHGIPTKDASRTSEKKNRVVSSEAERGGAVGECGQ
eukprot:2701225-Rhodomonas_salina.3